MNLPMLLELVSKEFKVGDFGDAIPPLIVSSPLSVVPFVLSAFAACPPLLPFSFVAEIDIAAGIVLFIISLSGVGLAVSAADGGVVVSHFTGGVSMAAVAGAEY